MTPALAIDVRGLAKSFGGRSVIRDLALQVPTGAIFGFLGPNGAGKTTTIRMICGLLKPDGGEGTCLGFDVLRQSSEIKRATGYMTQRFSLYGDLTVRENLDFVARIHGLDQPRAAAVAVMERVGLTDRERQLAGELSGGWKQRLSLAACILPRPRLLLLDEPTAGLDPLARQQFWDEIHALAGEGVTVLVTTHYMDEAERCHRLAYLAQGELLVSGTVPEVVASSGIATWSVSGGDVRAVLAELRAHPDVASVTAFGGTLRVAGRNASAIEAAIAGLHGRHPALSWQPSETGLEDVFVDLLSRDRGRLQ